MRIAVPTHGGKFCEHFGRCTSLFLCEIDDESPSIGRTRTIERGKDTSHCESLPEWCAALGVNALLVGGMGVVARQHFQQLGIAVSVGHSGADPITVVLNYVAGQSGGTTNPCDTFEHRHHHCRSKGANRAAGN